MEVVKKCDRIKGETYILKGEPRVWLGCAWGCKCGKSQPNFNLEGKKPMYCFVCKEVGMVNVKNKKCNCGKRVSFNLVGKRPMYCSQCKTQGMIDVKNKRCKCGKRHPIYNHPGLKARYCSDCKEIDMVDVKSKKCKCGKSIPNFNYPGLKAMYCNDCRISGMIDVRHKKCKCGKSVPYFNHPGLKAMYCSDCKGPEMVDVKSKKCIICKKTQASFNHQGLKADYCSQCKKEGMINVVSKKCITCKKTQPIFNHPGKSALYCSQCRSRGMIDVKNKKCAHNDKIPGVCDQYPNPKYRGYCTHCFSHLFPNDPLTSKIRTKTYEIKVRDFINSKFQGFIHDKSLWTGNCDCSHRRRIDHRRLISNTLLCIETDENKHSGYNKQDEFDRYDDLMMVFSGKWIFIRFNPNTSFLNNGKRRNPSLESRLPELEKEIQKQIERIQSSENGKMLEIVKMYY